MRYLDFKSHFSAFRIFSVEDVRKWDPEFDTRRLVEWQQKNYIKKLINRWYIFSDIEVNESLLFLASNRIYSPSYISLESALKYYNLIPEGVFKITAVTSLKTKEFETPIGVFSYRHIKPELFFGYRFIAAHGQHHKIGEPEKVLLDYFYLNTTFVSLHDFESLRLNVSEWFSISNTDRLKAYAGLSDNKMLEKRIAHFLTSTSAW